MTDAVALSHPEAAEYGRQLQAVVEDARTLCAPLSAETFNWQPGPGQWSVGQCLEHLNITERAMLPGMRDAAERIRAGGRRAGGPTRHGWLMGWFIRSMEPPVKRRLRTGAGFLPPSRLAKDAVLAEFVSLHDEVLRVLERVDGYDLGGAKVPSPFVKLLRYRLGSALALMAAHDRRHVWQARQVAKQIEHRDNS